MRNSNALFACSLFLALAAPPAFADRVSNEFSHYVKPGQAAVLIDGELVAIVNLVRHNDKQFSFSIKGPMGQPLKDWVEASLNMTYVRKSGEVVASDFDGKVTKVLKFRDAGISGISMPPLDSSAKDAGFMTIKWNPEFTRYAPTDGPPSIDFSGVANWTALKVMQDPCLGPNCR